MSPNSIEPLSGCSVPTSIRKNVVLPAPLPPMMPMMLPLGTEKLRFSIRVLSGKPLQRPFTWMTLSPNRLPGGMYNSDVSLRFWKSCEFSSSKRAIRALLLDCLPLGFARTHSSSDFIVRSWAASFLASDSSRCSFVSSQLV